MKGKGGPGFYPYLRKSLPKVSSSLQVSKQNSLNSSFERGNLFFPLFRLKTKSSNNSKIKNSNLEKIQKHEQKTDRFQEPKASRN